FALIADEVRVAIDRDVDIVSARQKGRELASHCGLPSTDLAVVATAISELARNIVRYAVRGEIILRLVDDHGKRGIEVVAADDGPGIPDVALATQDGALVAVVDGLGHGAEAADAAKAALRSLERHAHEPILPLIRNCHRSLAGTRGVVMSVAVFDARAETVTWVGVGNVEGVLLRAQATTILGRESLLLRGGVVGGHLPALAAALIPVSRGDALIFATDGIRSDFVVRP